MALGFDFFKQGAILNFVVGKDVFVSLPTGGGKSLCYAALPSVFDRLRRVTQKSLTVVVSPLNALMQDQVSKFTSMGMTSVHITDGQMDKVTHGEIQLRWLVTHQHKNTPTFKIY